MGKKKKIKREEYVGDINLLYFDREPSVEAPYRMYPDCTDFFDDELFMEIVLSAIEQLAMGHVVLYDARYKLLKEAKRRLFGGGWKPARFSTQCSASELKQELIESNWNDGVFADYETFEMRPTWPRSFYRIDWKNMDILQEKLDTCLLRRTDLDYSPLDKSLSIVSIKIFPFEKIEQKGSPEATIAHYEETPEYMLSIYANIFIPRAYIELNTKYMSEEELFERLKTVALQYNKKLERYI